MLKHDHTTFVTYAAADDIDKCGYCGYYNSPETAECAKCGAPLRRAARLMQRENTTTVAAFFAPEVDWHVIGIDVSQWQGAMDWNKAKPLITFAYIRAGIGNNVIDTQFVRNAQECQRLGIPFGLYWYMKPDKSWAAHADSFATAYNSYGGDLPPVFDVEDAGGLGKTALESWLVKACNSFENQTGKPIAIYTSAGFWNGAIPLTNWAKNRRLWVAHWTSAAAPILPAEWSMANNPRTWTFWQHSADGNGLGATYGAQSASIDLNRYNGSLAEFNAAFGLSVTPPVEPPAVELPPARVPIKLVRVTTSTLNIRAQPSTAAADIGDLKQNSVVPVYGEFAGEWYDIGAGWIYKLYTA